jgi:hypothetical protein
MTDDVDRNLMRTFAAAATPLPADDFTGRLMLRVTWRRRSQVVARVVAVVVLLFLVGAFATHCFVTVSLLAAERFGELLISPSGWMLSLLVAVVVLRRWRPG